jgi:hypothetical protein
MLLRGAAWDHLIHQSSYYRGTSELGAALVETIVPTRDASDVANIPKFNVEKATTLLR